MPCPEVGDLGGGRYPVQCMKHTRRCPKCQGQKFWQLPNAEVQPGASNATIPLVLAARRAASKLPIRLGRLEVWVCAQCGYAEWYMDPTRLQAAVAGLSQPQVEGIHWVDGTPG